METPEAPAATEGAPTPSMAESKSPKSQLRRAMEASALVALWMLIGFAFNLDGNEYLFIGVPLTVLFQLLVSKSPIRALWVRLAPTFDVRHLKGTAVGVAGTFALINAFFLVVYLATGYYEVAVYEVFSVVGCIPLAYSLNNVTRETVRPLLMCFGTAGAIGLGTFIVAYAVNVYTSAAALVSPGDFLVNALISFAYYIPAVFLLEEVSFRGAVDSYLYRPGEGSYKTTALFTSVLWGLWHLPITYTPGMDLVGWLSLIGTLVAFQGAVGYFLSVFWRRTGNLFVTSAVHAVADSVRNGFGG